MIFLLLLLDSLFTLLFINVIVIITPIIKINIINVQFQVFLTSAKWRVS